MLAGSVTIVIALRVISRIFPLSIVLSVFLPTLQLSLPTRPYRPPAWISEYANVCTPH